MEDSFEEIEKELIANGNPSFYRSGEYIFKKNTIPEYLYWIEEGEVLCLNAALEEQGCFPHCQLIGLRELLSGEPYKVYAATRNPAKVYKIHKEVVLTILNRSLQTRATLVKYIFRQKDRNILLAYE